MVSADNSSGHDRLMGGTWSFHPSWPPAPWFSEIPLLSSLLSEDSREKYHGQYDNKQGGNPHPTDSSHTSRSHHPATHHGPGHHSAAEKQQEQGYNNKRDDEGCLARACTQSIEVGFNNSRVRRASRRRIAGSMRNNCFPYTTCWPTNPPA